LIAALTPIPLPEGLKQLAQRQVLLAQRENPNKPNAEHIPLLGYALRANPTYNKIIVL